MVLWVVEGVAFHAFRSLLARHSEVFADMFTTPGNNITDELKDGSPVVKLSDKEEGWG